jgi:hypothetical protein
MKVVTRPFPDKDHTALQAVDWGKLRVEVELSPEMAHFADEGAEDAKLLRTFFINFIGNMLADLGIPSGIDLSIRACQVGYAGGMPKYSLSIDGSACRLPFQTGTEISREPRCLAIGLLECIYLNRQSCLPLTLSEKIGISWLSEAGLDAAPDILEGLHAFLQRLIERNFRIDRGKQTFLKYTRQIGRAHV